MDSNSENQISQDYNTDEETEDELSGNVTSSKEDSDTDDSDGEWTNSLCYYMLDSSPHVYMIRVVSVAVFMQQVIAT